MESLAIEVRGSTTSSAARIFPRGEMSREVASEESCVGTPSKSPAGSRCKPLRHTEACPDDGEVR